MNGMADIIPPQPVQDGLLALLAPASASSGWLLAFTLLIALALLLSAWLMRRRLLTRLRLAQAKRSLRAGRVDVVEKLLRQHHELAQLHPAKPPMDVNAACWRALIEGLHEARFGRRMCDSRVLCDLLGHALPPQFLVGRREFIRTSATSSSAPCWNKFQPTKYRGDVPPSSDQGSCP